MSPEAVLSRDALPLAVRLCPWAEQLRVRCDPATPHDALAPLLELRRLRELCVACVTSGERSLLDFADIVPVLQRHGPTSLVSLQLKVMVVLKANSENSIYNTFSHFKSLSL